MSWISAVTACWAASLPSARRATSSGVSVYESEGGGGSGGASGSPGPGSKIWAKLYRESS